MLLIQLACKKKKMKQIKGIYTLMNRFLFRRHSQSRSSGLTLTFDDFFSIWDSIHELGQIIVRAGSCYKASFPAGAQFYSTTDIYLTLSFCWLTGLKMAACFNHPAAASSHLFPTAMILHTGHTFCLPFF